MECLWINARHRYVDKWMTFKHFSEFGRCGKNINWHIIVLIYIWQHNILRMQSDLAHFVHFWYFWLNRKKNPFSLSFFSFIYCHKMARSHQFNLLSFFFAVLLFLLSSVCCLYNSNRASSYLLYGKIKWCGKLS